MCKFRMLFDLAIIELEADTVSGEHLLLVRKLLELDTSGKGLCSLGREYISWLSTSSSSTNSAEEVEGLLTARVTLLGR